MYCSQLTDSALHFSPRSYTFSRRKLPFCFSYLEIKCPDPGIPDNGQRSGSLFYEGTQVRFSCDDGFELDGLRSLECVRLCYSCSSVRWNGTTPTCRRIGKYFCPTSDVFPLCHWSFLYIKVLTLASCIRWSDLVSSRWVGLLGLFSKPLRLRIQVTCLRWWGEPLCSGHAIQNELFARINEARGLAKRTAFTL